MSNDLVQLETPRALASLDANVDSVNKAIAENVAGGGISDFDLQRITIASGGSPRWIVPTLNGEDSLERIHGVIPFARDTRTYYRTAYGQGGGVQRPDCASSEGIIGQGDPGGPCRHCPLSEFGSAQDGNGQACRLQKQLFFLRGDALLPEIVSLPPTSLKAARQFFLRLTTQGVLYYQVLVTIEIEKAQNAGGIQYGRALLKFVRKLTPDEAARSQQYHELCRSLARRVPTDVDSEGHERSDDKGPF